MKTKVITRFPPSPTGFLHIGSARTALFNHLFAAKEGGEMKLRFEDTDRERSKPEFEKDIVEGLAWLGIPCDAAGAHRQSERGDVYRSHLKQLVDEGFAYEGEPSESDASKKIIRFKNPNKVVAFHDLIRGDISFDTTDLGDFVIAKNMDEPLYHLAVVIDDAEAGVTHVVRGEDHISNTPRQILILEALGFARPQYAHIPLILAPDRSKLSKRHGAVSVNQYRAQGFIPESILNYLALLGWNPGTEQELFTLAELEQAFSLERVHKGGAVFDIEKLKWFNHEHLKRLSDEEYLSRLGAFMQLPAYAPRVVALLQERAQTLEEARGMIEGGEFSFLDGASVEKELLLQKGKLEASQTSAHLNALIGLIDAVSDEEFTAEAAKNAVFPYATEHGRGSVLWPMRTSLSGREKSPDPFTIAALIGKAETLRRIEEAAKIL